MTRERQERIAAAGNTAVPAYLTLIALGYAVDRTDQDGRELWTATKGSLELMADDTLALLGLCLLRSARGPRWPATDSEIDAFMRRFYPDAGSP